MSDKKTVDWNDLESIKDRTQDVRAFCARLLDFWGYDLESRKPGVAFTDEEGTPVTNLDLAAFLSTLVAHRTVINVPTYKAVGAATKREGEYIVSKENRHGRLTGLTSHQEELSFGCTIEDMNVIQSKTGDAGEDRTEIGAYRSLTLQGPMGKWYDGWDTITILPTGLSKEVFERLSGAAEKLKFQYFVHPLRWTSLYGKYYVIAKAAIQRLEDEEKFTKAEIKRLRETLEIKPTEWPKTEKVGEEKKIQVWAVQMKLDGFELTGDYEQYPDNKEAYTQAMAKKSRLGGLLGQLRFLTRATEFSFWQNAVLTNIKENEILDYLNGTVDTEPRMPAWTKQRGETWLTGWKEGPKSRTCWASIQIKPDLHLRWRAWLKTKRIAVGADV